MAQKKATSPLAGVQILSFAPNAGRGRLNGFSFSIWNTNEKTCGITFSADISNLMEDWTEAGNRGSKVHLDIGYNRKTRKVYLMFAQRGELKLNFVGNSTKGKNLSLLRRRDVVNKLGELLKVDFTNPATKVHAMFRLNPIRPKSGSYWFEVGAKLN